MVAPVLGPFIRTIDGHDYDLTTVGYKQSKPYDLVLPYQLSYTQGTYRVVNTELGMDFTAKQATFSPWSVPRAADYSAAAYNAAYERLRARISDSAGWGENIAQASKSRKMIVERASQLAHFVSALRQKRFRDAAMVLRTPTPTGVSNRKAAAQNFLEYEYGVKPLISDIQSSMKVLTSDPGTRRVTGSADEVCKYSERVNASNGYTLTRQEVQIGHRLVAHVRVTNPNLFLANQLGLLDLALPWKLIPLSFVVDWFVNVEQVISSCTDHFGLALTKTSASYLIKGYDYYYTQGSYNDSQGNQQWSFSWRIGHSVGNARVDTIAGPTLVVKPFRGFSLQRGAQAIALVLSIFGR